MSKFLNKGFFKDPELVFPTRLVYMGIFKKRKIFFPCKGSKYGGSKFNLKKKSTHPPLYGVKEFVCLSVTNFDINYLRTGKIEKSQF